MEGEEEIELDGGGEEESEVMKMSERCLIGERFRSSFSFFFVSLFRPLHYVLSHHSKLLPSL